MSWQEWRRFVLTILDQGRPMTPQERKHADELVKRAKRQEKRKAKRLAVQDFRKDGR
ncbi:MAG: hypothetical protein ACOX44_04400 [Limnochordia bacterium]|jgi:hypothetical protein